MRAQSKLGVFDFAGADLPARWYFSRAALVRLPRDAGQARPSAAPCRRRAAGPLRRGDHVERHVEPMLLLAVVRPATRPSTAASRSRAPSVPTSSCRDRKYEIGTANSALPREAISGFIPEPWTRRVTPTVMTMKVDAPASGKRTNRPHVGRTLKV